MLGKNVQLKTTGIMGGNRGEAHHSEQNVKDRSLRTIGSEFHTQWLNIIARIKEALCLESNLKYTREVLSEGGQHVLSVSWPAGGRGLETPDVGRYGT